MYALKFSLRELQDLMGKKLQIIASRKLTSVIFDVVMDLYCQSSAGRISILLQVFDLFLLVPWSSIDWRNQEEATCPLQ